MTENRESSLPSPPPAPKLPPFPQYTTEQIKYEVQHGVAHKQSATTFIDRLLSHDPRDPQIFNYLDIETYTDRVHVLRTRNKIYTLIVCVDAMVHADDDEDDDGEYTEYFRLQFATEEGTRHEAARDGHPHHFVRVGWLMEHTKSNASGFDVSGITTNFSILLNISTTPTSIWVAYDYVDKEDGEASNTLESYYGGEYVSFSWDQPLETDNIEYADLEDCDSTAAKPDGFLGTDTKWDLAMISDDAPADWIGHAKDGLNVRKVKDLIRQTAVCRGNTLRAIASDPAKARHQSPENIMSAGQSLAQRQPDH